MFNTTAGAFTLTLRTDSLDPGCVIQQGNYSIIRSDGTNMDIAFTATAGTVTSITAGTGLTATPNPIVAAGTLANHHNTNCGGWVVRLSRRCDHVHGQRSGPACSVRPTLPILDPDQPSPDHDQRAVAARKYPDETLAQARSCSHRPALGTPSSLTLTDATGLP